MHFINIHTHKEAKEGFAIQNLFPVDALSIKENKHYSIGIHPWEVTKIDIDKQLSVVKEIVRKKNVLAIGEIGLDKLKESFNLQKEVFFKQIEIAKEQKSQLLFTVLKHFQNSQEY